MISFSPEFKYYVDSSHVFRLAIKELFFLLVLQRFEAIVPVKSKSRQMLMRVKQFLSQYLNNNPFFSTESGQFKGMH